MNHPNQKAAATLPLVPCAISTRKSTKEGLEQEFNRPATVAGHTRGAGECRSHSRPRTRLNSSPIMIHVDTPRRPSPDVPTDPDALWDVSKRILFHVAKKVRQAVRLKLDGHGRGQAEVEELVHDAFLCVMEALPRFNPAAAKLATFVYGLARRRMWLVARAEFYGLSPEQLHRMETAKRTPHYHRGERALAVTATGQQDASVRESIRRVAALQQRLPVKDWRLITLYCAT